LSSLLSLAFFDHGSKPVARKIDVLLGCPAGLLTERMQHIHNVRELFALPAQLATSPKIRSVPMEAARRLDWFAIHVAVVA
jgi:hypothetical protein